MKKIALFGVTGQTGKEFANIALQNGCEIKALARNPEKLDIQHPKICVAK